MRTEREMRDEHSGRRCEAAGLEENEQIVLAALDMRAYLSRFEMRGEGW